MTATMIAWPLIAFLMSIVLAPLGQPFVLGAEPKAAWQADWEKTVKAAEEERELVIYMTQAFEPVFRDTFQKKFPKSKSPPSRAEVLSSVSA